MGDILWGTPAIRAIKKALPQVEIDLILQPQWRDLFFGNKNIRRLISYHSQWYRQIIGLPKMLQSRYDHVLIFHANRNISRILPWLRCKSILSHQYPDSIPGIPINQIVRFEKPVHGILRRLGLLEKIKIPSNGTHMDLFLNDNDQAEAFLFLKKKDAFFSKTSGGRVSLTRTSRRAAQRSVAVVARGAGLTGTGRSPRKKSQTPK